MTNLTTVETAETVNQGKTINIVLEKLEGGFISNVTGKRAIYKDAFAVTDAIDLEDAIKSMDDAEYHLDIRIVPKEHYVDYNALVALHNSSEDLTLESAKENGIIEGAEKFNPLGAEKVTEPDIHAPIKVTIANAYTADRLKTIDWAQLHQELPLQPSEITRITGMNNTTLYSSLPKARRGEFSFQHSKARVGFTILAQYYEKTLGHKTTVKEKCEKMQEDFLLMIRDIEMMAAKAQYIKSSVLLTKIIETRKSLLI